MVFASFHESPLAVVDALATGKAVAAAAAADPMPTKHQPDVTRRDKENMVAGSFKREFDKEVARLTFLRSRKLQDFIKN